MGEIRKIAARASMTVALLALTQTRSSATTAQRRSPKCADGQQRSPRARFRKSHPKLFRCIENHPMWDSAEHVLHGPSCSTWHGPAKKEFLGRLAWPHRAAPMRHCARVQPLARARSRAWDPTRRPRASRCARPSKQACARSLSSPSAGLQRPRLARPHGCPMRGCNLGGKGVGEAMLRAAGATPSEKTRADQSRPTTQTQ